MKRAPTLRQGSKSFMFFPTLCYRSSYYVADQVTEKHYIDFLTAISAIFPLFKREYDLKVPSVCLTEILL